MPLLCSPNNPTGGVSSRAFVEKLLDAAPVVLLDQAYVEFAAAEDDFTSLVGSRPNVVVFRTLSKAYAAAGFRIGYAVASPDLAREIDKAVLPFNVDLAAEELALALLARPESAKARIARVVEREGEGGCGSAAGRTRGRVLVRELSLSSSRAGATPSGSAADFSRDAEFSSAT